MTPSSEISNASHKNSFEFTNTPNLLTLARIAMVPGIVFLLFQKTPTFDLIAAIAFGLAAATDWLDGHLARKRGLETVYGKLMDPLADKFLVVSSLCMLQELGRIPVVVVILLICREMAITGLRALASSEGLIIGASSSAKWKTATQMVAIPFLMLEEPLLGIPLFAAGQVLIYISLLLSLGSAVSYIIDFFRAIQFKATQKRALKKALRAQRKIVKRLLENEQFKPLIDK